jgi:hypothetical protein
MMTPTVARIGQPCSRIRISSKASPQNSAPC